MDDSSNNSSMNIKSVLIIGGVTIFIIFFIAIVAVLHEEGIIDFGGSYNPGGLVYETEYNFEETMVTVMDVNNTTVLATVSLEDYIIGNSVYEIGAYAGAYSTLPEHYIKTQYIAAKTWLLSTKGYNSATKSVVVKASTADQQWCDIIKGCYEENYGNGLIGTFPGGYNNKSAERSLTESDLEIARQYYSETYGELYLPDNYDTTISSLTGSTATFYVGDTQNFWKKKAQEGYDYRGILTLTGESPGSAGYNNGLSTPDISTYYKNKTTYQLKDHCKVTYRGGNGTLVELEDYPDVTVTTKVNAPITQLLSGTEIDHLNNYIIDSVNKSGYGTGAGVAAAAQSLIYGLYQYGYHLPYWYGGGHVPGITLGVDVDWGKSGGAIDPTYESYNDGKSRYIYSYDCSGFVSWAIKNACKADFAPLSGSPYLNFGDSITQKEVKPGDVLVYPKHHIQLVVKNNGADGVTVAESTSGGGVIFKDYKTVSSNYTIVDMSEWYSNNCNASR